MELLAVGRVTLHALDGRATARRQAAAIAEHVDLHALTLQLGDFPGDVLLEQVHQRRDLRRRAVPVFLGEREQRQDFDARLDRAFDRFAHRLHPGPVTERARQPAFIGPAAVAVHDDRDVARNRTG